MTVRCLGPGIYVKDGELHIDTTELCVSVGMEPTPENEDRVGEIVLDIYREVVGHDPENVEEHHGPPPWRGQG